jgi:glycosyltransferase involved in cell wall biosynthesis
MKLSVVVPCYNEESTIREILHRVEASPLDIIEVIVIDDNSTDGTRETLLREFQRPPFRLIMHRENKGKGAALRSGFKCANGDVVVIQDADLEYDPGDYGNLLKPILEGETEVAYGSRFKNPNNHTRSLSFCYLINSMLTRLSNIVSATKLTDMETCMKMLTKRTLDQITIEEDGFGVEPEITAKIARLNLPIREVGISYHRRTHKQGKKIGWKDGIETLWCIFKYNLCPSRGKVKHEVLRESSNRGE